MKNPTIKKLTSIGFLLAAGVVAASAESLIWDPSLSTGSNPGGAGTWNLNTTANWFDGVADVTWKDNSAAGTNSAVFSGALAGTVTLNTSLSVSNLQFTAPDYTISGSGTLTLGAGGIDASTLSSGTTTLGVPLALAGPQQSWLVGAGSTLAINGSVSRSAGAAVDFPAGGVTSTTLANASGILGGWATVGAANSAGGDWAANGGSGNIITYASYTDVSGDQTGAGASAQNWRTTANAALTASATINSLNELNDFTVGAGATLTLNSGGIILGGISRWLLHGNATTSFITSGAGTGELFVHSPNPAADANNWTIWPVIKDNGATPVKLIKDGAGLVKLGNDNTFTGGTIVNAGTVCTIGTSQWGQGLNAAGLRTPFGTGNLVVNNGAQIQLGIAANGANGADNAFAEFVLTNNITVNGGMIYEWDAFQHLKGTLAIGAGGATLGATFDGPWDPLNKGFAKGLFVDGLLTGTGNLTIQHSGLQTGNAWNSSTVYFTSTGTAAQNTYSGTVIVNPFNNLGGSYLYLIGTNALANANIELAGDNTDPAARFGVSTLLFGSGTNLDGAGYATIGSLSGSGSVVLANTLTLTTTPYYGAGAPVALTVGNNNASWTYSGVASGAGGFVKDGTGTFTLAGANTYTGDTVINGGSVVVSGSLMSSNYNVAKGATLDVSAISFTVPGSLQNGGTVNGSVDTASGSKVYGGTDGAYGTNTITGNLTLASGATVHVDVGTTTAGANDRITVAGAVTANNNSVHLKAPSTATSLQAVDYTIITAGSISGSFSSVPVWDVVPANSSHFTIVTSSTTVTLHYSAVASPSGTASASPSSVTRNQATTITVNAVNGTEGTVTTVVVDASPIGGSSTLALVSAGGNVWTNTIAPTPDTAAGSKTLVATLTDNASPTPMTGLINIPLTVTVANDVWSGAGLDNLWSNNLNWTNKAAPGYVGDSLEFPAGTTYLTPSMNNNYTVTSVTFDAGAGSFNLGTASSSVLTMTANGLLAVNSANAQTLSVPMSGGLTKTGNGALNLAGANTHTSAVNVRKGTLNFTGSAKTGTSGLYVVNNDAASTNNARVNISSDLSVLQMWIGDRAGAGQVGAVYQTAGVVSLTQGASLDNLRIGSTASGQGYYKLSGGSLSANEAGIGGGADNTVGVMDMTGGTFNSAGWICVGRGGAASSGMWNITGGSVTFGANGGDQHIALNMATTAGAQSVLNVANATVTAGNSDWLILSGWQGGGADTLGVANLLGGSVVTVWGVDAWSAGPTDLLQFNGGTLKANGDNTSFLTGGNVDHVYIYSGGGTIDNNGFAITVGRPLEAATGSGVTAVSVANGGSGYVGAPMVKILGGTGAGATAVANMVDDGAGAGTFRVGSITVTSPGVYTANPTNVTVLGGGPGTAASGFGISTAANTSGGMTFDGAGTTTVTGSNTYTGNTTISAGTVALAQPCLAAGSTVSIAVGAVLQLDFTTTNRIAGLVIDGISQDPGVYDSTTSGPNITGYGYLEVVKTASYSTNISYSVSGNTMTLSWPATHQGWFLQAQTNSISTGLSNNWVDIAGTEALTTKAITINPAAPTVFYRLRHP